MSRYYFHLRYGGDLREDDEGVELRDLSVAREEALNGLRALLGEALRFGRDMKVEALIIADEDGRQLAAIPITAALPPNIIERILQKAANVETARLEECRQQSAECYAMADKASNYEDKREWLKLAEAWLHMLPREVTAGWPKPGNQDSQASH
jgi:hypothetical protein